MRYRPPVMPADTGMHGVVIPANAGIQCIQPLALIMLLIYGAAALAAPDDAKVRKALEAKYAGTVKAFQNKDARALFSIETPDFIAKLPGGRTMSRKEIEADFTRQMNALSDVTWIRKIDALNVKGKEAVAVLNSDLTGTMADPQGKNHILHLKAKSSDTWVRSGRDWKLKQTELLESNLTIDGKSPGPPQSK